MDGLVSLATLGFLLGVRHAVDPDHIAAVSAIAAREASWRRAAMIGALWGVGHTATILLLGGAIIIFRLVISARVGLALELGVAVMLIMLGVLNVVRARAESRARSTDTPAHSHAHDDVTCATRPMRPLLIGMMHGLAGSAAIALMILAMVRDTVTSMAYLLLFGTGTIVGMMIVTTLVALPAQVATKRAVSLRRWLTAGSGAVAIGVGLLLAYQIVGVSGFFSATPTWVPR
ncbi:MAG: high-affinity nickel-transport family protein [Gemmatimonadaceae bacterium]